MKIKKDATRQIYDIRILNITSAFLIALLVNNPLLGAFSLSDQSAQIQTDEISLFDVPLSGSANFEISKYSNNYAYSFKAIPAEKASVVEVLTIYLTMMGDPLTEVTINWQSRYELSEPEIAYRLKETDDWNVHHGLSIDFPHTNRYIHRNNLSNLKPGSIYEFRVGGNQQIYSFKTLPEFLDEPLVFLIGGDLYQSTVSLLRNTTIIAARQNPAFAVLAGDLAMDDGEPSRADRWFTFFDNWLTNMVTQEGHLVPILPGIGNHENSIYYNTHTGNTLFFYHMFQMPHSDGAYYKVQFGDYLSIIMLDSQHSKAVAGEQTQWLEQELIGSQDSKYVFPVYHVGAYPSSRNYTLENHARIRQNWVPLFEQYGIKVAFEHHEHHYKRTYPLKGNKVDEGGVVFIGDGGWGASPRSLNPDAWYIEKAMRINSFNTIELDRETATVTGMSNTNRVIDTYTITSYLSTNTNVTQNKIPDAHLAKAVLRQNYPNPFSQNTNIKFEIREDSHVVLRIFDMLGKEVGTLVNENKPAGIHKVSFLNTGLPEGVYFYRLDAAQEIVMQSMIIVQ